MGVPAFFQWLRERYPTMMHEVMEGESLDRAYANAAAEGRQPVQRCDHLYLDFNGIVHPCCHPEDGQPQPKSEEEMLRRIEAHLDRLMELMRPTAFVYFALDGVAPRAKMNQQRTRRYVAAQERAEAAAAEDALRDELAATGQPAPEKKAAKWDHNVITPGTEFMRKLADFLRAYCARRARSHPRWKHISFLLSDATVPGEGEHKIISYVRALRQQEGYDPATQHCIVGEDADLIMLSLALHEENFLVLRKRMKWEAPECDDAAAAAFGNEAAALVADEDEFPDAAPHGFHLVQIRVLRGYLKASLAEGCGPLAAAAAREGGMDYATYVERVIDDFVFLCFFCGNDFLPHLPSFDIREGALDVILELYRRRQGDCAKLGDALLTNGGTIIPSKAAQYLTALAEVEAPIFERRAKRKKRELLPKRDTQCAEFTRRGHCKFGDACEFKHGDHVPAERADERLRDRLLDFARSDASDLLLEATLSSRDRKQVHAIAEDFGMTHNSEGDGADRRIRCAKGPAFVQARFPRGGAAGAADAGESDAAVADKFMEEVKRRLAAEMTQKHGSHENDAVGLGEGPGWRERYYKVKLDADDRAVKDVCREYWRGLQWVLSYYYSGCASWVYYYERHYAPFACDLAAYAPLCPPFWDKKAAGEPFKPLAQLLAVIPPGSAHCLPEACRLAMGLEVEHASDDVRAAAATARGLVGKRGLELMFPTKIKMDPNGRKHQWEWVALLPFLDERKLTTVIDAVAATFDDGERARNTTRLGLAAAGAGHARPPFPVAFLNLSKLPDEPPYLAFPEPADLAPHLCRPVGPSPDTSEGGLTGCEGRERDAVWKPGEAAGKMRDTGEARKHPRMRLADLQSAGRMIRYHAGQDQRHAAMAAAPRAAPP